MTDDIWAGGCQCGAVRFQLRSRPTKPYICHCRMCQKQFASFFAAWVDVAKADFFLTRGALSYFKSSDSGERGFCRDCGTPLTYSYAAQPRITVAIGAFDRHAELRPEHQYGVETREPWFATLPDLPASRLGEDDATLTPTVLERISHSSRQHPDHETDSWPPAK